MTFPAMWAGLRGSRVLLEPLTAAHRDALLAAATEDRASFALTNVPRDVPSMTAYIDTAERELAGGTGLPFAVVDTAEQRVVGSTRFNNIQRWSARAPEDWDAVEIGWTWLAASAQRSGINREMKLLMLEHAFDVRHARRVFLKTDARNFRSRDAIAGIGATFEGILRNHGPASDGPVRDVAMFAIVDRDWPEVASALKRRLRVAAG